MARLSLGGRACVFAVVASGVVVAVAACVGDDPGTTSATDGGGLPEGATPPGDAGVTDAIADAAPDVLSPRCNASQPFGAPSLAPGLTAPQRKLQGRLSDDELTIFFSGSTDGGTNDVFVATRTGALSPFGTPQLVRGVNTSAEEVGPSLTRDRLTMYLASNRPGGAGALDLYVTTRPGLASDFATPVGIAVIDTAADESDPYILPDNGAVYYWAQVGPTNDDIFRAKLGAAGFDPPQVVQGLASTAVEAFPVVSADERTIYFSSPRPDPGNKGGFDIWTAHRAGASFPFDAPTLVPSVNSSQFDAPSWISPDDCVLYLSSDRDGTQNIYVARRPP